MAEGQSGVAIMHRIGPSMFERVLDDFIRHLRRLPWVREVRFDRVDYDLSLELSVRLHHGEPMHYRVREDEWRMGGEEALRHWIETVDRDLWERGGRYRPEATPRRRAPEWHGIDEARPFTREQYETLRYGITERPENTAANERAKKLFRETTGEQAFTALEKGEGWPITGSNGTAYKLHKRASYCVTRVSDGAKLCAVVPGVPLYDHLLGIKLMVEQDEERFLKTANVAADIGVGRYDVAVTARPGARIVGMDWAT